MNIELAPIITLLNRMLSDDPVILSEQAREVEGYYARIMLLLASARNDLATARIRNLKPKTKELSEKEREIALEAAVATEQAEVDSLEGIAKAIAQRVIFTQSLLKSYAAENVRV